EPGRLLTEIRRVLKPNGVVLILGEHRVPHEAILYGKNFAKYIGSRLIPKAAQQWLLGRMINSAPLFPSLQELLKPDSVMGDHYYVLRQYEEMISAHGFVHHRITTPRCPFQAFVLVRQPDRAR